MKEIKNVGIIGLGALGVMYAHLFTQRLGRARVFVLADSARIERYRQEGVWYNGQLCNFQYADAATLTEPIDLLLFAVKFGGLESAMETCRHLVGPDTTLISVLNGISSEPMLGTEFAPEQVVWCVAQKMAAKKDGNYVIAEPVGELAIGVPPGCNTLHFQRLTAFFEQIDFPHALPADIRTHMWGKLLCNTGSNQANMVFQCSYAALQIPGEARDIMLDAMREVVAVANAEGIPLSEADVQHWVSIIDTLPPEGETSMRQDAKAHRKTEVELFAGTIRRLAKQHGISVPANDWLYQRIQEMEASY